MNNGFKELFQSNYRVIENTNSIDIFYMNCGIIEQEVYIKCRKSTLGWTILKSIRGNNFEIGTFSEEEYAICVLYTICVKNFEVIKVDSNVQRKLRKCEGENAKVEATKIIGSECESKYFSLDKPQKNSICMENIKELYNVFYLSEDHNKINIVSDVNFNRAIVVVYNFSLLLKEFNKIYEQFINQYPIAKKHYEELFRYYLNK